MIRSLTLALVTIASLTAGMSAQQAPPDVAGKWEVSVTGRPVRLLDLTLDGAEVAGTLTKDSSEPAKVTGELKVQQWGFNLGFKTAESLPEFFTLVRDGAGWRGTYSYCNEDKTVCFKTGVKLKRPER
jgi:hypothetical protein